MTHVKITVLRRMSNPDLYAEYCQSDHVPPCAAFTEGQEFIVQWNRCPKGFCSWAWKDIQPGLVTLLSGGSFSKGWMKDANTLISCCTDGIQPVVFKLERIED